MTLLWPVLRMMGNAHKYTNIRARGSQFTHFPRVRNSVSPGTQALWGFGMGGHPPFRVPFSLQALEQG